MPKTTVYLVLEPKWSEFSLDENGDPKLTGFDVARALKSAPRNLHGPYIKLTLGVPAQVFAPMRAAVEIEVPEHVVHEPVVTVELPDLTEGDDDAG